MSVLLVSNESKYVFDLPHGKPNTKIPLANGVVDARPRVLQKPQPGNDCFFYAMNILRCRIGPNPGSDYTEARKMESLCSKTYKKFRVLQTELREDVPMLTNALMSFGVSPNKKSITDRLDKIKLICMEMNKSYLIKYFENFCAQNEYDNLIEYTDFSFSEEMGNIFSLYLKAMNQSPKDLYERDAKIVLDFERAINPFSCGRLQVKGYDDLCVVKKASANLSLAQGEMAKAFGFKKSKWSALNEISELQSCLKDEGAILARGYYGRCYYSKPASVVETIEQKPIYGWKPTDRLPADHPQFLSGYHAIVIIGTDTVGPKGGYVYFVDPLDGSDPQNPLQRKIYKISYQSLTSQVVDLVGIKCPPPKRSSHQYALYYPANRDSRDVS